MRNEFRRRYYGDNTMNSVYVDHQPITKSQNIFGSIEPTQFEAQPQTEQQQDDNYLYPQQSLQYCYPSKNSGNYYVAEAEGPDQGEYTINRTYTPNRTNHHYGSTYVLKIL